MIAIPAQPSAAPDLAELVKKYDGPIPRYTSYPTAAQFSGMGSGSDIQDLLGGADDSDAPLSLYFHLPFCRRSCWFCGCTRIISSDSTLADRYLGYLEKEVDLFHQLGGRRGAAAQLHLGGGSPNFLEPAQLDRLTAIMERRFAFAGDAERCAEIDPRTLTVEKADAFRRMGINRVSIGVQDLDPQVQLAINRVQTSEMNREALRLFRDRGVESVNIDLVYGLPHQTVASFEKTLDEVLTYDADRFAVFGYAHIPWMRPAQRLLERVPLPGSSERLALFDAIAERLTRAGYVRIGLDHFTKPTDALAQALGRGELQRNFQGYSLHPEIEIQAFGMSAISQSRVGYRQNTKGLDTYYKSLDEGQLPVERGLVLSEDDRIRHTVIMGLMCNLSLDYDAMGQRLGIDFQRYFAPELKRLADLERDGLIERGPRGLQVTATGRQFIRVVAARFDAYYEGATQRYSRAI